MLVAYSHLRWGFVWQRPQHLLTRFARRMPVLVVEEPEPGTKRDAVRVRHDNGVTVVTPLLVGERGRRGFNPLANSDIGRLIEPFVTTECDAIYWYYTPMALGAEPPGIDPVLAVYDAMDDLASFLWAPPALRAQESRLLQLVDMIFAGGPTLYRQRRDRHHAVHCFPSGVDQQHFAAAMNGIPRPLELSQRPRPILGYYGVIDERIDLQLVADIADLRPEWTIALVGPTAKIDPGSIPIRDNLMVFGKQAYDDLPGFLACFDVALMPFALNEATRAISPTKTLEYLAGGRPVVSTPVADVVDLYGDVVSIAATAADVVSACEFLLQRSSEARRIWQARAQLLVREHSWDAIADEMLELMSGTLQGRRPERVVEPDVVLTA